MKKDTDFSNWGKDHWSLLAYFETRAVDFGGIPDLSHMRVNSKRGFTNGSRFEWMPSWGTKMKNGIPDGEHDDIDVMEELEETGFIINEGTLLNPKIKLTKKGFEVVNKIRHHKASDDGSFSNFIY